MAGKGNTSRIEHRRKYYRQYNLVIEKGTVLEALLDRYQELNPVERKGVSPRGRGGGLSGLVREALADYFGVSSHDVYSPERIDSRTGRCLPRTHDLDASITEAIKRRNQ